MTFVRRGRLRLRAASRQPLISNSIFLTAATAINNLAGFFFWLLAARLYPTQSVGLASTLVSSMVLVATLANLGLGLGIVRYYASNSGGATRAINSCLTITFVLTVVVGCVYLAGLRWWSPALTPLPGGMLGAALFLTITVLSSLVAQIDYFFLTGRRAGYVFTQNAIQGVLKVTGAVLATSLGVLGLLSAVALAVGATVVLVLFVFLPRSLAGYRFQISFDTRLVRPLLRFSLVNQASIWLWSIPSLILPILVLNRFGPIVAAHFFIAWAMASLVWAGPAAVGSALFAEGAYDHVQLQANIRRSLWLGAAIVASGIAVAYAVGEKLLSLFGTGYAADGTALLHILAWAGFPLVAVQVCIGVLRVKGRLVELCLLLGAVAVAVPALAILLLPYAGLTGVVFAFSASQTAAAVVGIARILAPAGLSFRDLVRRAWPGQMDAT